MLPVLGLIAQIAQPTDEVRMAVSRAMRKAALGPGNWVDNVDPTHLSKWYGQTISFHDIDVLAQAAQLRMATWENYTAGGIQVVQK